MFVNNMFIPAEQSKSRNLNWINYVDLIDVVKENMYLFNDMYRAGCGYDNFSSLFRNIAFKVTGINDVEKLNWDKFDDRWCDMLDYTNHPLFANLQGHFKTKSLDPHYKILTDLLNDLCQIEPQM